MPGIDDGNGSVPADTQEVRISGDEVVDATRRRATQQVVVVWVAADARRPLVREKDRLGPQELLQ